MEEEYTVEKMVKMFNKIHIDNFLIECLKVIERQLIHEGGVTNPAQASDSVASVLHVIKEMRKQDFCNDDVDLVIQKNIPYLLKKTGVMKE